jgi:hypothetical protein
MRRRMFLTTASAIVVLCAGTLTAVAAEGEGHGGEHGGEHGVPHAGGKEDVHVDPHSVLHGDNHVGIRLPPKEIPHEGGVSIFGGTEHRPDGWRYRYENGAWWYWQPNNHWTYYDNGGWQNYVVEAPAPAVPVASDPNFYWYNNQWWYWTSDKHWSYYDKGHWRDGAPGMGPKRREEEHFESHKNEHGPHVDEHEGPRK